MTDRHPLADSMDQILAAWEAKDAKPTPRVRPVAPTPGDIHPGRTALLESWAEIVGVDISTVTGIQKKPPREKLPPPSWEFTGPGQCMTCGGCGYVVTPKQVERDRGRRYSPPRKCPDCEGRDL